MSKFKFDYRIHVIAALRALQRNKFRSMLTSIGIIIGISSVIAMIGLGNSVKIAIIDQIFSFGKNGIFVSLKRPNMSFTDGDLDRLKKEYPQIIYASPADYIGKNDREALVKYRDRKVKSKIQFASADYFPLQERYPQVGRLFTKEEVQRKSKVVVIGTMVELELMNSYEDPIGKSIWINGASYEVIGVLDEKGEALSGRDFDRICVIPFTVGLQRFMGRDTFRSMLLAADSQENLPVAEDILHNYIQQKFHVLDDFDENYLVSTSEDKLKMARDITNALTILLAGIASISLFVGGVGIMNIMLVSVTERTREIGIRMAIGAKKMDIMLQFLMESVFMSCLGGTVGVILGLLVYYIITVFVEWPFVFSISSILLAFAFSASVGIFFGYYPSRTAANLKPIEALRYE